MTSENSEGEITQIHPCLILSVITTKLNGSLRKFHLYNPPFTQKKKKKKEKKKRKNIKNKSLFVFAYFYRTKLWHELEN